MYVLKTPCYARGSGKLLAMGRKKLQSYNRVGSGQPTMYERSIQMDNKSLAHTTWNCKYHIVFAPKYRRQVIYGEIKADIGQILRQRQRARIIFIC